MLPEPWRSHTVKPLREPWRSHTAKPLPGLSLNHMAKPLPDLLLSLSSSQAVLWRVFARLPMSRKVIIQILFVFRIFALVLA